MGNPLPLNLAQECRKAQKILTEFVDPAHGGLDRVIPMSVLRRAQGFAIFSVARLGFLMSARAGSGVVVARMPDNSWSPPSALGLGGLGAGFNAGLDVTDFLIVLNSKQAVRSFMATGSLQLGGNLSVAVGPLGRAAEASGNLSSSGNLAAMFSYSKSKGLYGGVSVEGTVLVDRSDANSKAYHRNVTAKQILSGSVECPGFAQPLLSLIEKYTLSGEVRNGLDGYRSQRKDSWRGSEGYYGDSDMDSLDRDLRTTHLSSSFSPNASPSVEGGVWDDHRKRQGYAFADQSGGTAVRTNSPTKTRKTFLGDTYARGSDYSLDKTEAVFDVPSDKYSFHSSSQPNGKGTFAKAGVQPRRSAPPFSELSEYGAERTRQPTASFPTKFDNDSSTDESEHNHMRDRRPQDPFDLGDYEEDFVFGTQRGNGAPGRAGLSSRNDKYDHLDTEVNQISRRAAQDKIDLIDFSDNTDKRLHSPYRRKPSGMDALDKELQQSRGSLSTDESHEKHHGDRPDWRADYGLPPENYATAAPPTRPQMHARTSSAQRLWNRVRGNSQSKVPTYNDWRIRDSHTPPSWSPSTANRKTNVSTERFHTSSPSQSQASALADAMGRTGSTTPKAFFSSRTSTPAAASTPSYELQVVAMFDFEGQEDDDLSFKRGDVIDILRRTHNRDDWWLGRCHGNVGNLPANFTKDL